jgi:hypothetical protein
MTRSHCSALVSSNVVPVYVAAVLRNGLRNQRVEILPTANIYRFEGGCAPGSRDEVDGWFATFYRL